MNFSDKLQIRGHSSGDSRFHQPQLTNAQLPHMHVHVQSKLEQKTAHCCETRARLQNRASQREPSATSQVWVRELDACRVLDDEADCSQSCRVRRQWKQKQLSRSSNGECLHAAQSIKHRVKPKTTKSTKSNSGAK